MPRTEARTVPLYLSWDAVKRDVCGLRSITWTGGAGGDLGVRVALNVPQELWLWPDVGMSWGRDPREAVTLALAVLDRHLGRSRVTTCHEWHRPLCCDPWAYRLAWVFAEQWLLPADYWCLRVSGSAVASWYEAARCRWDGPGVDLSLLTPAERFPL